MLKPAIAFAPGSIGDVDETLPSAPEITRYRGNISSSLPSNDRKHNLPHNNLNESVSLLTFAESHIVIFCNRSYYLILTNFSVGRYKIKFQRLTHHSWVKYADETNADNGN